MTWTERASTVDTGYGRATCTGSSEALNACAGVGNDELADVRELNSHRP